MEVKPVTTPNASIRALLVVVGALAVVACGDDSGGASDGGGAGSTQTTLSSSSVTSPAGVFERAVEHRTGQRIHRRHAIVVERGSDLARVRRRLVDASGGRRRFPDQRSRSRTSRPDHARRVPAGRQPQRRAGGSLPGRGWFERPHRPQPLLLRQLGPDDGWFVLAAVNDHAGITDPVALAEVAAGPLAVHGMARGFEGSVTVSAGLAGSDQTSIRW